MQNNFKSISLKEDLTLINFQLKATCEKLKTQFWTSNESGNFLIFLFYKNLRKVFDEGKEKIKNCLTKSSAIPFFE